MNLNLTKPLAFLDLETTGVDPAKDHIVEIAVVKINPDGSTNEKTAMVNPQMPIPPGATRVHKITDEMVKNEPPFSSLAKSYFIFLNDCDFAGFNSTRFDLPILVEEFHRAGIVFNVDGRKLIDVQRIFHKMEPRNLTAAYKFYCKKDLEDAHSAMADAKATYEVLMSQLDRYGDQMKNDADWLHEFSKDGNYVDLGKKMYYDEGVEKFNFGKHKGKAVKDVFKSEPAYFDWIMRSDFPSEFKLKIQTIKER